MKNLLIVILLVIISGCAATLSPDAQKVVIHTQLSSVLSECEKLGNVTGVYISSGGQSEIAREQSINNLRDQAYKKYHADTVALANIDVIDNGFISVKYVAQGLAFKCN